ncbi:MAG: GNAT family N-acetyltransferase [Flavobacteriales bacterium]
MTFNPETDYILSNERVELRPLLRSDFNLLKNYSIEEPELWKYSLTEASSPELLQTYIELALNERNNKTQYPFIVFDKKTNQYAGSTRFYDIQVNHQCLQLGFTWYGKEFHGTGLNQNCKYLMLEFAFEKLDMQRVEFRADFNNKKSIAAMKKIGCTEEGILRSNCSTPDGERRNSIVLSILKSEWENGVKSDLIKQL